MVTWHFSVAAPKMWNELPLNIRKTDSLPVFDRPSKHFSSLCFLTQSEMLDFHCFNDFNCSLYIWFSFFYRFSLF